MRRRPWTEGCPSASEGRLSAIFHSVLYTTPFPSQLTQLIAQDRVPAPRLRTRTVRLDTAFLLLLPYGLALRPSSHVRCLFPPSQRFTFVSPFLCVYAQKRSPSRMGRDVHLSAGSSVTCASTADGACRVPQRRVGVSCASMPDGTWHEPPTLKARRA